MNITVTGRGITVRDALKEYAEQKASKLQRLNDQLQKVEVILTQEGDDRTVEMIATPRRGDPIVGHASHEDPMAAVDLVVDKMTQQLRRQKEKREDKRKRSGRVPPPPEPSDLVKDEALDSYQDAVDEFSERFDPKE
jgi:putative sigma-54 modulation protein